MKITAAEFKTVFSPMRTLAYIRNVGPYMGDTQLFERLFSQVLDWVQAKGLVRYDMESIAVYHDDPETVPPEEQRISVGFTVPTGSVGEGDIQIMTLPAGKYAVGSFEIHPDQYGEAWEQLYEYIQSSGLKPGAGPMYESYKNDPQQHPEGKHVVDICVALKA